MKKLLLVLWLAFFTSTAFSAIDSVDPVPEIQQTNQCEKLMESSESKEILARSGCCSYHSGVCGCSGGRATCCDGSLSPSCGCHKDESINAPN